MRSCGICVGFIRQPKQCTVGAVDDLATVAAPIV